MPSCVRIQKAINTVHWSINLREKYLQFSTTKTIYPPMLSSLAHVQTASRLWKMLLCVNSSLHIWSAAICPDPPEIDHGSVNITGNCIGDYAHYACDPGFKLTGDPYLTCEKLDNYTAAFQPNPPVCHRECCMNWLIMPSCINHTRIQRTIITVH